MIEVSSLTKRYGSQLAVQNLSFKIHLGEVVGLLGLNGAGKTTTMRLLTGYLTPTSGHVSVAGFDLKKNPHGAKKNLGYLPENLPFYPELTVEETLSFVAGIHFLPKNKIPGFIDKALIKTGLTEVRRRLVGNISKGYRQRLGIAQAILHEPPFLILDEPTVGLDPKQIVEIRQLIQELRRESTILLSSHILQEVNLLADRVMIIHHGKLVYDQIRSEIEKSKGLEDIFFQMTGESSCSL